MSSSLTSFPRKSVLATCLATVLLGVPLLSAGPVASGGQGAPESAVELAGKSTKISGGGRKIG